MNFQTQYDAILEALKDKETTRTLLIGMLTKLSEIHEQDVKLQAGLHHEARESANRANRRIMELQDELRERAPIDALWKSTHGERLIELAYRQDPRAATRELNALNGSGYRIAQELRDRKLMKERELPGAEAAV